MGVTAAVALRQGGGEVEQLLAALDPATPVPVLLELLDTGGGMGIDYGEGCEARPADFVRAAVEEGPLVCPRTKINGDCPVAIAALDVIDGVAKRVDKAVRASLAALSLADLVKQLPGDLKPACAEAQPASPTLAA